LHTFDPIDYERKLAASQVRLTLARAGLVICGYELLREAVVGGVRGFFTFGFAAGQAPRPSDEYAKKVRSAHKSEYQACVAWLVEVKGLDPAQAAALSAVKVERDKVVHELPYILVDPGRDVDVSVLVGARQCLDGLGKFWASVDISVDPDLAHIDAQQVKSGASLIYDHLIAVAAELEQSADG
jgi:hypothetical protein